MTELNMIFGPDVQIFLRDCLIFLNQDHKITGLNPEKD